MLGSYSTFDLYAHSAVLLGDFVKSTHLTCDLSTVVPGAMREGTTTATSSEEARVSRTTPSCSFPCATRTTGCPTCITQITVLRRGDSTHDTFAPDHPRTRQ